jgi:hypothetical protein
MLEAGIQELVVADAGVQALIGTRFYPVILPENIGTPNGPPFPAASFQVINDVPDYILSGVSPLEVKRLQVDTWSGGPDQASYASVRNVQAAIRAVLEGYKGTLPDGTAVAGIFVANARDLFEQDPRAYRTTTDYMIHFYPAAG